MSSGNPGIQTILISPEALTKPNHSVATSSGTTVLTVAATGNQAVGPVTATNATSVPATSSPAKSAPMFRIPEVTFVLCHALHSLDLLLQLRLLVRLHAP
jgi:hypothetical protein